MFLCTRACVCMCINLRVQTKKNRSVLEEVADGETARGVARPYLAWACSQLGVQVHDTCVCVRMCECVCMYARARAWASAIYIYIYLYIYIYIYILKHICILYLCFQVRDIYMCVYTYAYEVHVYFGIYIYICIYPG